MLTLWYHKIALRGSEERKLSPYFHFASVGCRDAAGKHKVLTLFEWSL